MSSQLQRPVEMTTPRTTPRVLVIDDNRAIHDDFRKVLGAGNAVDIEFDQLEALLLEAALPARSNPCGSIVIDSAFQGKEGYEMVAHARAEGRPYCLAFVDIRMPPGWDGIETVLKIWETDPEIQIVICSAYSDYSWEDMVRRLGESDRFLVLKKPFDSIEVRQLASALSQRWHEARTDVLTGLLNRRAFSEESRRQTECSDAHNEILSCVMLDLDYFKLVNDQHGHLAGDYVLRTVAGLLTENARPGDFVCRFGGEELCILLRGADEEAAFKWSDSVRQAIETTPFEYGEAMLNVTGSFGVAERSDRAMSIDNLIDRADRALRIAKRDGRNRAARFANLNATDATGVHAPDRFDGVNAADLMQPLSVLLDEQASLKDSVEKLIELGLDSAPVVNSQGALVGSITNDHMLTVPMPSEQLAAPTKASMRRDIIGYEKETPLREVFECLVRASASRVVVLEDGRPCGFIDRTTLVRWLFTTGYRLAHPVLHPDLIPAALHE